MILHSKPWITDTDIASVVDVLKSGMIAQGNVSAMFEQEISQWVGAIDGVAVGCGAGAIVLALRALEICELDEVILPTYVCPSVLDAVVSSGSIPILCDVGEDWVVSDKNIKEVLSQRSKAIIIPHMYGISADINSLKAIGLPIIEDCAQALAHKGSQIVSGDITIFSFHPTKCLTAGEGGIAVTSNLALLRKMKALQGKSDSPGFRMFSPMSDINAALGLAQLSRYPDFLNRRAEIANEYIELLHEIRPSCLPTETFGKSMFFRFPIRIEDDFDLISSRFNSFGVCVRRGVDRLLHRLIGLRDENFFTAVKLFNTTLSLPIYPAISREELNTCKHAIKMILANNFHKAE